jgi:glycosyltransferase involved in cell wall biosynthesis
MKISIVTITLNRKDFLRKAIESVLRQNYKDFEHIVIDGGSSDGTRELLLEYPHLRWISEKDKGQADAMNKGLNLVTGVIFGWLNSDDTYPDGTFTKVSEKFKSRPDISMIYGRCNLVNKRGEIIGNTNNHNYNLRKIIMGFNDINTPAVFVLANVFNSVGNFNLSLKATYDVDMWIRIGLNCKVSAVNCLFSNLCLHDGSGLVGERAHLRELPILRKKYWKNKSVCEVCFLYPYYKMREWLYEKIKFTMLLSKI